jgi:glyoxylase-like metal-dependent hydrolase (beta-lactamase superfamily II)
VHGQADDAGRGQDETMRELVVVHRVPLLASNAYLVEGHRDGQRFLMVVDTGIPGLREHRKILSVARQRGFEESDITCIFVTHAHTDHYGSAGQLRQQTGAPIVIHELDAQEMRDGHTPLGDVAWTDGIWEDLLDRVASAPAPPTDPDVVVADGDSLNMCGFDGVVWHLPGHTAGHSGLLFRSQTKTLALVGDLISNLWGIPQPQKTFAVDWSEFEKSLEKAKNSGADRFFPGHGPSFSRRQLQELELGW